MASIAFLESSVGYHFFSALIKNWGRALTIATLLSLIAFGVERKTAGAVAPPIYDALSYVYKAKSVWREIGHGHLSNLLNTPPTNRPPGSVIFSYPFGFADDWRGFLFRMTFAPIAIWVYAFWIATLAIGGPKVDRWLAAAVTLGFSSLSMFYQFEWDPRAPPRLMWGFVDCLVAALGALAVALMLASAKRRSYPLALIGSLVAAWTLLVKPVGLLLMLVVFAIWVVEVAIATWPPRAWKTDQPLRRYVTRSGITMIVIFIGITELCLNSEYLSPENWKAANQAASIFISQSQSSVSSGSFLLSAINPTVGWYWFLFITLASISSGSSILIRIGSKRIRPEDFRFLTALLILAGAAYWLLFMAGYAERYYFPFVLVFLCLTVPQQLARVVVWRKAAKLALMAGSVAPALLLVGLLLSGRQHPNLERLMGVNLNTGHFADEVRIGDWLFTEAGKQGKNLKVYSPERDVRSGIVGAVGSYQWVLQPRAPGVRIQRATSWHSVNLVRIADILSCEFILFRPAAQGPDEPDIKVLTWEKELLLFRRWFSSLSEDDGVSTIATGDIVLLEIFDHQKLGEAFSRLMRQHQWRDEFYAENFLAAPGDLARAVKEGTDTKLRLTSASAADLKELHQVSLSARPEGILVRTTGDDPYIRLPRLAVVNGQTVILKVVMDAPTAGFLQVYHASGPSARFSERESILKGISGGHNEVYFVIRCGDPPLSLRIDLTTAPEAYLIEEINAIGLANAPAPH